MNTLFGSANTGTSTLAGSVRSIASKKQPAQVDHIGASINARGHANQTMLDAEYCRCSDALGRING